MSDPIRDSLDDAIGRVATSLVSVADDPDGVQRIVSSLPVQRGRGWWLMSSLPLQAAAVASVVLVVAYMRSSSIDDRALLEPRAPAMTTAMSGPAETRPDVPAAVRQVEVKPRTAPVRRAAARQQSDVEAAFGLAAIAAPAQLTLGTLTSTTPLDPLEPASVPPISLSGLPLASDGQTPFSKE